MRQLLYPLAIVYGLVVSFRNFLYDRRLLSIYESPIPIISVGNITAGGNAKTPLALAIAAELKRRGRTPVILSRGYKGRKAGPVIVAPTDTFEDVGDEPLLMAAETDVVVSRDRVAGAKFIEGLNKFDVIILDDGFQHRRLAREIDIVSIDVGSPDAQEKFVRGELLPLGRFREPRNSSLARSHLIILAERGISKGRDPSKEFCATLPKEKALYRSSVVPGGAVSVSGEVLHPPAPVIAFCAIANPTPFFETLRSFGLTPVKERSFPDHHVFTKDEIESLRNAEGGFDERELPLVCTVKDAVKLRNRDISKLFLFTIDTTINPREEFFVNIINGISKKSVLSPNE